MIVVGAVGDRPARDSGTSGVAEDIGRRRLRGSEDALQDLAQRGLSRSVGANERKARSLGYCQSDIVEDRLVRVVEIQILDLDDGLVTRKRTLELRCTREDWPPRGEGSRSASSDGRISVHTP